jgi:subfamily B ATP-binding cassette protein MsbA
MAPITRGLAAVERGVDLIEQTPAFEAGGSHATRRRARGEIVLRDVKLRYRDDSRRPWTA